MSLLQPSKTPDGDATTDAEGNSLAPGTCDGRLGKGCYGSETVCRLFSAITAITAMDHDLRLATHLVLSIPSAAWQPTQSSNRASSNTTKMLLIQ